MNSQPSSTPAAACSDAVGPSTSGLTDEPAARPLHSPARSPRPAEPSWSTFLSEGSATGKLVHVSDVHPDRPAEAAAAIPAEPPPWWLITSWGRWTFWIVYPLLMSWGPIERIRAGRVQAFDVVFLTVLSGVFAYGLVLLVMTLLAYRRDPSLRNRTWAPRPRARPLSRNAKRGAAFLTILTLGLVSLISTGWGPALFVTVVLGAAAIAIDRFNLFTDDASPAEPGDVPPPARDIDVSGR